MGLGKKHSLQLESLRCDMCAWLWEAHWRELPGDMETELEI